MRTKIFNALILLVCLLLHLQANAQKKGETNSFNISAKKATSPILISENEAKVVSIAANLFAGDVEKITEQHPEVIHEIPASAQEIIIAGTIGQNKVIDQLIKDHKIDVSSINGKWESWSMQVLDKRLPRSEESTGYCW